MNIFLSDEWHNCRALKVIRKQRLEIIKRCNNFRKTDFFHRPGNFSVLFWDIFLERLTQYSSYPCRIEESTGSKVSNEYRSSSSEKEQVYLSRLNSVNYNTKECCSRLLYRKDHTISSVQKRRQGVCLTMYLALPNDSNVDRNFVKIWMQLVGQDSHYSLSAVGDPR